MYTRVWASFEGKAARVHHAPVSGATRRPVCHQSLGPKRERAYSVPYETWATGRAFLVIQEADTPSEGFRRVVGRNTLGEGGTMHAHHDISRRQVLGLTVAIGGLAMARDVRPLWAQATGGSGKVSLDVRHSDLHTLITPETLLTRIAGGLGFTEGPVWRGGALLFTDIPNKRIVRWRRLTHSSNSCWPRSRRTSDGLPSSLPDHHHWWPRVLREYQTLRSSYRSYMITNSNLVA
jgi:hypothetical protein